MRNFLAAGALLALVDAHLAPAKRADDAVVCSSVNNAVTSKSQQVAATAFCSSYLSIPVSTVLKTTSTKTVKGKASVSTVLTTKTTGDAATTTIIETKPGSTKTVVTARTCEAGGSNDNKKRAAAATKPQPAALKPYASGPSLTSACQCLSVPTKTITKNVVGMTTTTPVTTITRTRTVKNNDKVTTTSTSTEADTTVEVNKAPDTCNQPCVRDGSLEGLDKDGNGQLIAIPYVSDGTWTVDRDAQFMENGFEDGIEASDGIIYAHFYSGDTGNGDTLTYSPLQGLTPDTQYTLTWDMALVQIGDLSLDPFCYMTASVFGEEIYRRDITEGDSTGPYSPYTADFAPTQSGPGELKFAMECGRNRAGLVIDNIAIN